MLSFVVIARSVPVRFAQGMLCDEGIPTPARGFLRRVSIRQKSTAYSTLLAMTLLIPFCMERALAVHPPVGMRAEVIALRLDQVGR